MIAPHVTVKPWSGGLQHPMYGTADTYQLAAAWLADCADVADWGGGTGALGHFLPRSVRYRVVDGTLQTTDQALFDLETFREPADGIALRHVLDINLGWREILINALGAFRRRMVVITFTPDARETTVRKFKSGWPILHFDPADLRARLQPYVVRDEAVMTSHPERIYYLEKGR